MKLFVIYVWRIKPLFIFIALCIQHGATAQNLLIKGTVVNKDNNSSISNVHIFTEDQKIGSISNQTGDFKLYVPEKYRGKYLYFSQIGFNNDSILISNIEKTAHVALTPQSYALKEIYVIPDSTLLTLLRKAYDRISENYPTQPTLYEGFYRESSQNEEKEQVDFIEAHLSIYKDPYDKPSSDPGKVELLKSRKRKIRNAGILYYGGPFLPIRKDVVLQRDHYINPRYFRKYSYEFKGLRASGDQEFYEISFSTVNQDTTLVNGTMLIEKESLAYAFFELKSTLHFSHPQINRRISHSKINYEKIGDKWYYKSYTSENEDFFRFKNKRIGGKIDYLTTHIQIDSVRPIPFARQLAFLEPFVLKAEEYNPNGWTDYSLLENTKQPVSSFQFSIEDSENIFNRELSSGERKNKFIFKLANILNRTYMDIGITYNPVELTSGRHHFLFQPNPGINPFQIDHNQHKATQHPLIYGSIGYRLNKKISLVYENSSDFFNKNIASVEHRLGLTYSKNLTNTGRLIFIEGSLFGAIKNNYVKLGKYNNPAPFRIDGKKIDASKISFWYGNQQQGVMPQIAVKQNMSRFFSLKIFLAYNIAIGNKDVFRIKEEKGGLFRKKTATIHATDQTLSFDTDYKETWNALAAPKWQTGIALVFN